MVDETAIEHVRTLVRPDCGLWVYAEVEGVEVIDAFSQTLLHRSKETLQGTGLASPLNRRDAPFFDNKADRGLEVGGDAYIS